MFAYCGNNPILNIDTCGTRHEEYAGGGGGGVGVCIGIGLGGGGGGGSVGGGGSATIDASYYGYTNVVNYNGGVGTAAANPFISPAPWLLEDLRTEHIYFQRRQKSTLPAMPLSRIEALGIVASKSDKPQYYAAEIVGQAVLPFVPLTYQDAKIWVVSGGNLLAVSHSAAFAIVKFFPSARWDGKHGCGKSGYLNHYHLSSAHGNHIWYLGE